VIGFAQPEDVAATLRDWFRTSSSEGISLLSALGGMPLTLRDLATASSGEQQMVRSPAWILIHGVHSELYAKPDDRWEANDIASRCPEIVTLLSDSTTGEQALPDELVSPWR
jgi:hypothetical protein